MELTSRIRLSERNFISKTISTLVLFLAVTAGISFAKPTTAEQAQTVVNNWLALDSQPFGTAPLHE